MDQWYYESIFKRKSTRRFKDERLSDEDMSSVLEFLAQIKPLFSDCEYDFSCVFSNAIKNAFGVKAPHYIVVSAKEKQGALVNVGYMLQQLDLFLSSKGIGGCWVGMAKPDRHLTTMLPYPFVIAYAFGYGIQSVYQNEGLRNRKAYSEISEGIAFKTLIEAARVAPSATNSQPWHFVAKPSGIDVYRVKNNPIKGFFLDRMNEIDIGIALCHLKVAAMHEGLTLDFYLKHFKEVEAIQGHFYMISAAVKP